MTNQTNSILYNLKRLNINPIPYELAFDFLESFEQNNFFEIKLIVKNKKNIANFYLKENYLEDLFGKRIKLPFALYLGTSHLTFYFRTKQEYLTKNIESLNIDFTKPKNKEDSGDYFARIYEKREITKFIDFVFRQKLNLKMTKKLIYPNEVSSALNYSEGKTKQILVNSYERNPIARKKCIEHFGLNCQVCNFNFKDKYGEMGKDFIHVHHIIDIASIGNEYSVNPLTDLIPVCPNCHSMLHKRKPAYSIKELKEFMN